MGYIVTCWLLTLPAKKTLGNSWLSRNGQEMVDLFMWIHTYYLVGGLDHLDYFFHILGIIIPTDELIFFRGVAQPPTRLYYIILY